MKLNRRAIWEVLEFPKNLFPSKYRTFADPATFHINKMLDLIPKGEFGMIALDCGAGPQNKKSFIENKNYIYKDCWSGHIFPEPDCSDCETW